MPRLRSTTIILAVVVALLCACSPAEGGTPNGSDAPTASLDWQLSEVRDIGNGEYHADLVIEPPFDVDDIVADVPAVLAEIRAELATPSSRWA